MKIKTTILLSAMIFGFAGCGSTGQLPQDESTSDGNLNQSVVPVPTAGEGPTVELKDYLFYNKDRIYKDTHVYENDITGDQYMGMITSLFTKSTGNQNEPIITQTINNLKKSEDIIYNNKITSYKYDSNGNYSNIFIEYPLSIQKNELFSQTTINGETTTCVLQDFEGGYLNLENKLPTNILNDLKIRDDYLNLNYLDVMHVYCGATDSSKTDIYYVSGIGKVLSILESLNKTTYEITSKNGFYE